MFNFLRQEASDTTLITYLNDLDASMQESTSTSCAWCDPHCSGDANGSHTICPAHAEQMTQSARDRRANRRH